MNRDLSLIVDSNNNSEIQELDLENPLTLHLLISAIQQVQFVEAVPWLLDNVIRDGDSLYCDPEARLFTFPTLSLEMLEYIVNTVPSRFSLAAVIDSLISLDSNEETYNACQRAYQILGDTDFPSWVSFANEADFQDNSMVWVFCAQQARRTAPYAKEPTSYLKKFSIENDKELVAFQKGEESLEEYVKRRTEDKELFRIWGPSNFQLAASEDEILDGYADHRMFTDERFTPEDQPSWFTGSCDRCWLKIRSPRHAVRKPLGEGGWKGQYCSMDCVRLDCEDYELPSFEMTWYYEKQLNDFGIYDHIFSSEEEEDVVPRMMNVS